MAESDHSNTPGKSPAFQFYPKDYLSDAKTRAMTFKQRGMYWDLVSHCWLEGHLPANPNEIARILGITTVARFSAHDWPVIGKCFRLVGDEHQHPRLDLERRKQAENREERSDSGKRGADKRWGKRSHDKPIAEPLPSHQLANGSGVAKNGSSSSTASSSPDIHPRKEREGVSGARNGGLMAGTRPILHGDCLVHGPVCFRPRFAEKYLPRFGGNRALMLVWATSVCEAWTDRVEHGENVPYGDDFAFWAAAYDEHYKPAAASSGPKVSDESIAEHIRKRAEERGVRGAH